MKRPTGKYGIASYHVSGTAAIRNPLNTIVALVNELKLPTSDTLGD